MKVKDSGKNPYPFYLGNISTVFFANNMKKTGLNVYVYNFYIDYVIYTSNIIDIHKYLMKKT